MKKNKKGFTIVELVIVIAVIAILAAVLIPTFTTVVKSSRESAVKEEARNSVITYMADNQGMVTGLEDVEEWTLYQKDGADDIYVYSDQVKYEGYIVVYDKTGNYKELIEAKALDTTTENSAYNGYAVPSGN